MMIGALLVPAFVSLTAFFINFIAIYYQAAKALHFTSMVNFILIINFQKIYDTYFFTFFTPVSHNCNLYIRDFAMQFNWYFIGSCNQRSTQPSMSCQRSTTSNTRKEMVHWTVDDYIFWWTFAIWFHIYWSVSSYWFDCFNCIQKIIKIFDRYFVFTSFWAYKIYYVYGFMLLVFLILIVVTVCVTIVTTYFLLNAEDYRW